MLGTFGPKKQIFSYLFPGCFFLMILGLILGVWDCKNKHLATEVLQKSTFAEIGFLMIPGSIFHDFDWSWDISMTFVALETGLKSDEFSE